MFFFKQYATLLYNFLRLFARVWNFTFLFYIM